MSGSAFMPIITRLETNEMPPTLHKLNKFTKAFQTLINSYGIATYREVNPGESLRIPYEMIIIFIIDRIVYLRNLSISVRCHVRGLWSRHHSFIIWNVYDFIRKTTDECERSWRNLGHVFRRSLYHRDDGRLFHLYRSYLQ